MKRKKRYFLISMGETTTKTNAQINECMCLFGVDQIRNVHFAFWLLLKSTGVWNSDPKLWLHRMLSDEFRFLKFTAYLKFPTPFIDVQFFYQFNVLSLWKSRFSGSFPRWLSSPKHYHVRIPPNHRRNENKA